MCSGHRRDRPAALAIPLRREASFTQRDPDNNSMSSRNLNLGITLSITDRNLHNQDHLLKMFGVFGSLVPETPNIYLIMGVSAQLRGLLASELPQIAPSDRAGG